MHTYFLIKECKCTYYSSAVEYQEDILPRLIAGGNVLFANSARYAASWMFQQDNARPHTAASTLKVLQDKLPGRVVLDRQCRQIRAGLRISGHGQTIS